MSARDFRGKAAIVGVGTAGCGECQVHGAKIALVNGNGGLAGSRAPRRR